MPSSCANATIVLIRIPTHSSPHSNTRLDAILLRSIELLQFPPSPFQFTFTRNRLASYILPLGPRERKQKRPLSPLVRFRMLPEERRGFRVMKLCEERALVEAVAGEDPIIGVYTALLS